MKNILRILIKVSISIIFGIGPLVVYTEAYVSIWGWESMSITIIVMHIIIALISSSVYLSLMSKRYSMWIKKIVEQKIDPVIFYVFD